MPHSVLLLGCGAVAKPVLDLLCNDGIQVTAACRTITSAKSFVANTTNATPIALDVSNPTALRAEIKNHDLVASLVPYAFHAGVIQAAIECRKHVVTTSYISPAIRELHDSAVAANLTILNELGMDPGLDHLWALRLITAIHVAGGAVKHFYSYAGGLPAPECSNNPLGFKFSWSPKGALLASMNDASYWRAGEVVKVPGAELMNVVEKYPVNYAAFDFVGYPNRSSVEYKERYGIPEASTVVRGSLRYPVYPAFVRCFQELGLLAKKGCDHFTKEIAWKDAIAVLVGVEDAGNTSALVDAITSKALQTATEKEKARIIAGLRWIGLLSDEKILPNPAGSPIDALSALLEQKLKFEPGERDMVMLQHKFHVENADGSKETRTATLLEYGVPNGYSAMAKLVGIPCAVGVKGVLEGRIQDRGVIAPVYESLAVPLLEELRDNYGIRFVEETLEGWI